MHSILTLSDLTFFKRISLSMSVILFCRLAQSQVDYTLDPIVVTASLLQSSLVVDMREVFVLHEQEIAALPVCSVSELAQYAGGVDLQRRGHGGVQADFSIRGSSFEQVLVLVDGVRLNDSQTGHYNSSIPLSISDVERIEILTGHGSSLYGSDGFGGVINIIMKRVSANRSYFHLKGGSFETIGGMFSQSFQVGPIANRFSFEKQKSDGYRWDTEYDITTVSAHSRLNLHHKEIDWSFGQISKDFGANGFYANYPSHEKTKQTMGKMGIIWQPTSALSLQSKLFGRQHDDLFILDCQHPAEYQNSHRTVSWGGDVRANIHFSHEKELAFGFEVMEEALTSSRLGNHRRFRIGLLGEWVYPISRRLIVNGGLRTDYQQGWDFEWNPTLSIKYLMSSSIRWRSSVGRIFRAPSFTELYYDSPANVGDPNLQPEYGWSVETGIGWGEDDRRADITFFWRDERNQIEWIAREIGDPWQVANIGRIQVSGLSVSFNWTFGRWLKIRCNYTDMKRVNREKTDYYSKYSDSVLKHHLVTTGFIQYPWGVKESFALHFKQKDNLPFYVLLDSKWTFQWKACTFFFELINLLNADYEEIPGVPMPGRCMMLGSSFERELFN